MGSYHTRWARPEEPASDPERIAIREVLALGKALFDIRTALRLPVAELALRTALTDDDIESSALRKVAPSSRFPCCAASPQPLIHARRLAYPTAQLGTLQRSQLRIWVRGLSFEVNLSGAGLVNMVAGSATVSTALDMSATVLECYYGTNQP